ncbi:hypothetical protein KR054_003607 [Drosophila jambulina]|nr:hypothetical protein KR054_003607 [Drosophila jambulina]
MQTWPYAMDVFVYQKQREKVFIIADYMASQVDLNPWKRRLLISWMVTVHQIYGTFRETLFLSVKIVDLYLSRHVVDESMLQLLGAAAFYIASKYEEKEVVPKEGLLEICHWEYTGRDLLQMEWQTLRGIGFDLGIPLGCRFLRRYARSSLVPEPTWTLASYILELALLEYSIVLHSDSQLAAAALFVALRMHGCTWNPALVHYSGYELRDFAGIVPKLNGVLHRSDCFTVKAVRSLYSTLLLHEVAKEPPLTNEQLFRHNPELYEGNVS